MPKKQLRTVKKSSQTGRLSREAVRSAVITVRDGHSVEGRNGGSGRQHSGQASGASNGGSKS